VDCHVLHEAPEELAPREGVQPGNGLIEDEEFRALRDGERQGELRALAA
jgi:hypothetical protein